MSVLSRFVHSRYSSTFLKLLSSNVLCPKLISRPFSFVKLDVDTFRRDHGIKVSEAGGISPITHLDKSILGDEVVNLLTRKNIVEPTPIQSEGWPVAFMGRDMVGIAQTGSGKTLGYILPALKHIRDNPSHTFPKVLVLVPTRELAQQVAGVAREFGKDLRVRVVCVHGGTSKVPQIRAISSGCDICVATPGRLLDLLDMGVFSTDLEGVSYVVMDEADRMLDMGFEPSIRQIMKGVPDKRQMLMWSATWPREIRNLAKDFLSNYVHIQIGTSLLTANSNITQKFQACSETQKNNALKKFLLEKDGGKCLVFFARKKSVSFLTQKLASDGLYVSGLHGDMSQASRDSVMRSFKNGSCSILFATDVASRGLDVNDIDYVVNFDCPLNVADYIHRIGRTARGNSTGTALTFMCREDEAMMGYLKTMFMKQGLPVPSDLANINISSLEPSPYATPSFSGRRSFQKFEGRNNGNRFGDRGFRNTWQRNSQRSFNNFYSEDNRNRRNSRHSEDVRGMGDDY